jgi:hypothetical protein
LSTDLALHWHVPRERRNSLRFTLIRLACMTVVFASIVYLMTEPEQQLSAVATVFGIALVVAAWQTFRLSTAPALPPNVWLDAAGFHWLTADGREHLIPRDQIVDYWLGIDEETHRALPALTFILRDQFLSQPIEMHPPVNATQLRDWFQSKWQMAGVAHLPEPPSFSLKLHSEFNEDRQTWLFQGKPLELKAVAEQWQQIASQHALPPLGARPQEIQITFGEQTGMIVCLSSHCWIEFATLSIPPELLQAIAQLVIDKLAANVEEIEIPLRCDTGYQWRLLFHATA